MSHSTNHSHKLAPFRHTLKKSWTFYKANWKKLIALLLPIEIATLVLTFIVMFGLTPVRFVWVAWLVALISIAVMLIQIFKKIFIFSGGLVVSQIEDKEEKSWIHTYKEILTQTMPIAWVCILQALYMCAVAFLTFLACIALFLVPFIVLSIISRVYPDVTYFISDYGGTITTTMFAISLIGFLIANFYFMTRVWLSSYTLLLLGRDGLDALADSAMFVRGRSLSVFWRMFLVSLIAILPIILILAPLYIKILIDAAKGMAIAFALGLKPVFPPIAFNLLVWKSLLGLLANLLWAPVFIVMNFFLWKDVKASAPVFEESAYEKTRKRIKICVWIGFVLAVVCPIICVLLGVTLALPR
jgi:hypothetical protein